MGLPAAIRPGRPGDEPELARLHALGFHEGWSTEDFGVWLARSGAFSVLAEVEGRVRAFGLALSAGEDVELLTIATDPSFRGRGLGAAILGALEAEAQTRQHTRWILEVATDNAPALALYRRRGFEEIGRRKGYYPRLGERCDALVLARDARAAGA